MAEGRIPWAFWPPDTDTDTLDKNATGIWIPHAVGAHDDLEADSDDSGGGSDDDDRTAADSLAIPSDNDDDIDISDDSDDHETLAGGDEDENGDLLSGSQKTKTKAGTNTGGVGGRFGLLSLDTGDDSDDGGEDGDEGELELHGGKLRSRAEPRR